MRASSHRAADQLRRLGEDAAARTLLESQWSVGRLMLVRRKLTQALPLVQMMSARCPSSASPGALRNGSRGRGKGSGSGAATVKLPMLRVSHCQTALFGKRGGGSGGGGLSRASPPRDECSEAATTHTNSNHTPEPELILRPGHTL